MWKYDFKTIRCRQSLLLDVPVRPSSMPYFRPCPNWYWRLLKRHRIMLRMSNRGYRPASAWVLLPNSTRSERSIRALCHYRARPVVAYARHGRGCHCSPVQTAKIAKTCQLPALRPVVDQRNGVYIRRYGFVAWPILRGTRPLLSDFALPCLAPSVPHIMWKKIGVTPPGWVGRELVDSAGAWGEASFLFRRARCGRLLWTYLLGIERQPVSRHYPRLERDGTHPG